MIKSVIIKKINAGYDLGTIELAPITLIFGRNGAGKTDICDYIRGLYDYDPASVIIIDKPESGMHPKYQMDTADIIIDTVKHGTKQIIAETHSEYLLRRLQRRIAEGVLHHKDVAVYHITDEYRGGKPYKTLDKLKIDESGNIHNWPDDFFGDELGEIIAQSKAALKKRS